MSKIAHYLNEHILGDVTTDVATRKLLSSDAGMLQITPEIIVYPRVTNDIRKVARFTHQLAEKGHKMNITARGAGTDQTGAALSDGILVQMTAHMHRIFEFDAKQRLVRVQPGASFGALNSALKLQGHFIPGPRSEQYSTVGGAVANNASGSYAGRFGAIEEYVSELEVVLANGDVIQTRRLTKRELAKKMDQQNLEGELYRSVEALLSEYDSVIDSKLDPAGIDRSGYGALAKVRHKNGSFDLTPLFVGAQGTLGVISEMILRTEFYNDTPAAMAMAFGSINDLHDALDEIRKLEPEYAEIFDAGLVSQAIKRGKRHAFIAKASEVDGMLAGVVLCQFSDFSERARQRKLKKALKVAKKFNATAVETATSEVDELMALEGYVHAALQADSSDIVAPPLFGGVYVPERRFEEFMSSTAKLAATHKVQMPYHGHILESVYHFWPQFNLRTAAEKQKMLKLYGEFAASVRAHGGELIAESGEGRIKAPFVDYIKDADLQELYVKLRTIFDPHGTFNAGVKQPSDLRSVVSRLRPQYTTVQRAEYSDR